MTDNTRHITLKVRVSDQESDLYRRAANLLGLTVGAFQRLAANEKAARINESNPKPPKARKEGPKCGPVRSLPGRRASAHVRMRL